MSQPVSSGAEIVGGLVVFFLIGMGLDAWLGTKPIFMIALTVFALVAQFVRIYVVYSSRMATLEARRAELSKGRQS